jgi:hypothetical protein
LTPPMSINDYTFASYSCKEMYINYKVIIQGEKLEGGGIGENRSPAALSATRPP